MWCNFYTSRIQWCFTFQVVLLTNNLDIKVTSNVNYFLKYICAGDTLSIIGQSITHPRY